LRLRLVCRYLSPSSKLVEGGVLRSSRCHGRHGTTSSYLSFTKGLRLFNTELRGRVYSVGGPESTAVFLSELPESLGLAAGRSPSCLLLGLPVPHVRFLSRVALRLPLLRAQPLPPCGDTANAIPSEHTTLQNILPCRTYYLAEHTTLQNILPCVTV
jgi:hypothetical protein